MTVLSLCMIVRDEEELLPACLSSVRGVVDELVVVDTGSRDQTIKLALSAGAKVVEFPWCNDFSAARNAALEASSGDWILVLDADERLAPGAGVKIREAIETPELDCGFLPLSDALSLTASVDEVLSGKARIGKPLLLLRLLRRTPDLRWRGVIHEDVDAWLKDRDHRSTVVNAPIIHYGYVPEIWSNHNKAERNLRLLEQRCRDEPENPMYWGNLAKRQLGMQWYDKAGQSADSGWEAAEALVAAGGLLPPILHLATIKIRLLLLKGKVRDALACLDQIELWCPYNPNIDFLKGQALYCLSLNTGDRVERSESLERALVSLNKCVYLIGDDDSSTIPGSQELAVTAWGG